MREVTRVELGVRLLHATPEEIQKVRRFVADASCGENSEMLESSEKQLLFGQGQVERPAQGSLRFQQADPSGQTDGEEDIEAS